LILKANIMITSQQIESWIKAGLPCDYLRVDGNDGQHFQAVIVSAKFRDLMRVAQHQLVYRALGDRMHNEIHALAMRTLTPEEWRAENG
jgi:acid stress-induced BolA-like protein IbaG/YrbA